jgi:ribose 5-phosphate isomerase B
MKIAIGADHRAAEVREHLSRSLEQQGHHVYPMGICAPDQSCDYPDSAYAVATAVASGKVDRGILICGTGIGMSIAANKVSGVRAALVHDEIGADMSRRHNDANVLCLSADMLGMRIIDRIVKIWIEAPFDGGRHSRRLAKVAAIEQGIDPSTVGASVPANATVLSADE